MLGILLNIIKIAFLLGFLVFIHEGGHFLIAKLFKIKVKEFAIGFGPTILSKQGKETKYALRLIPLGGFVSMLGENEKSEEEGSYSKANIPKKMGILVAGGLVNVIFGLLIYFILIYNSNTTLIDTTIKETVPNYAAEKIGIQAGDRIISINNKKIRIRTDIDDILNDYNEEDGELLIKIERNNTVKEFSIAPTESQTKNIGIYLGIEGKNLSTEIKSVYDDSPAKLVGIQSGDIVIKVDDIEVPDDAKEVVSLIANSKNDRIKLTVKRNDELLDFYLDPVIFKSYKIGVVFDVINANFKTRLYNAFWETNRFSISIVDSLKKLFTGKVTVDQLMGPIGISEVVIETKNFEQFIYILAIVSVSLGITNLLPLPPLDGGKIFILLIETIRRKPLKENTDLTIQTLGMLFILLLSLFVTFNDVIKIF
ncbi:MAG: site-2 protease family protein [Clostridia bacterium]